MVTGFAAERVEERAAELERRHGVRLELVFNDRAEEWNNAYSLWLAREAFADGALLVNGDTVHPPSVEETLWRRAARVLLAVDREKPLGEEEMKILLTERGTLRRISKEIDPASAAGEYIGVALIEPPRPSRWPTRSRRRGGATRRSTTRTGSRSWPTAAGRSTSRRSGRRLGGGRRPP